MPTEDNDDVKGIDHLLANFALMEVIFQEEMDEATQKAIDTVYEKMLENISLTCHTLQDLKAMGHPYSKENPQAIHQPEWLVHLQSGRLIGAVKIIHDKNANGDQTVDIGIDEDEAPYAKYIIFGTSKMVARDFVTGTFEQCEATLEEFYVQAHTNAIKRDP